MAETTVATELEAREITPGVLFYWKSWRVEQRRLQVAEYRELEGQLGWIPDPRVVRGAAPRAVAVLLDGEQVAVQKVVPLLQKPAPRLQLEVVAVVDGEGASARPGNAAAVAIATVAIRDLIGAFRNGSEIIDAARLAT
jgi:hypothetical protein